MRNKDKNLEGHKEEASRKVKEDLQETATLSKKDLEELQKKACEKEEIWDKYLRLYADYENSRKLWDKQRQELLKFGNSRILREFVSIIDEIEAALSNLKDKHPEFEQGLSMIYKKIKEVLQKEGLKPIESEGKIFDPYLHEALFFEERQDLPEHSIIEVIQKGYFYEDKVLRPAKVKVSIHRGVENKKQSVEESIGDKEETTDAKEEQQIEAQEEKKEEIKEQP